MVGNAYHNMKSIGIPLIGYYLFASVLDRVHIVYTARTHYFTNVLPVFTHVSLAHM